MFLVIGTFNSYSVVFNHGKALPQEFLNSQYKTGSS